MTKLMKAPKSHKNILITRASLEWGNIYSLFFDLAKMDLSQYFTDKNIVIDSVGEKATIFGRTIGLAGALAFLHEEIQLNPTDEQPKSEQLQCYHLDLKPQNILVFEEGSNHIWKISDFGISRIKTVPHGQPDDVSVAFLDKIFKPEKNMDTSSGVPNTRFGGTYAAPEARELSDMVTRKSDVWSLGCVLALVLTFLESQSSGIHKFQKAREKDRVYDWFFDSEALTTRSDDRKILHSSVSDWLDALNKNASKRGGAEGPAFQRASRMLQDRILIRESEKRISAKQVQLELTDIHSAFAEKVRSPQTPDAHPQSKRRWRFPPMHSSSHRDSSRIAESWERWEFKLSGVVNRCKFSPDGNHLAIVNNKTIAVKSRADIKNNRPGITHDAQPGKSWADFNFGSKYLCVAADSDHFEVTTKSSKVPMQIMLTRSSAHFSLSQPGASRISAT